MEHPMTTTVKLPDPLEKSLRQRCAQEGRSISEVMRDALVAYLAQPAVTASAWALGEGIFGRYSGPEDLAETRKSQLAEAWADKHAQRS
jgi:plasmid stability protein